MQSMNRQEVARCLEDYNGRCAATWRQRKVQAVLHPAIVTGLTQLTYEIVYFC